MTMESTKWHKKVYYNDLELQFRGLEFRDYEKHGKTLSFFFFPDAPTL